jgi:hypothetical protein
MKMKKSLKGRITYMKMKKSDDYYKKGYRYWIMYVTPQAKSSKSVDIAKKSNLLAKLKFNRKFVK